MINQAYCWAIELNSSVFESESYFESFLTREEKAIKNDFRLFRDKRNFLLARAGIRFKLSQFTGLPFKDLEIVFNKFGKPKLKNEAIEFNISHAGDIVLISILKGSPIGVDVELNEERIDESLVQFLHKDEIIDLEMVSSAEFSALFYRCWTRKEAVSKALGFGLSLPLDSFRISFLKDEASQVLHFGENINSGEWSIFNLPLLGNYTGAMATPGKCELNFKCQSIDEFFEMI
nr:4'-phosphopantetheinyl transferase superfamily protein [uncultured Pedobacter sp.]